ncbi:hypothetical protein [Williamsia sp. D3]|uniref:hypothetical protein n=1 Tax=Williamsia sp. D3 TaxID=1313067 RepID=UPI0003D32563|nr:hypothetical protein [Williamsia sp. D3]ETD31242.1 hypothetical protein W823_19160 [Williamsia sp. D3]
MTIEQSTEITTLPAQQNPISSGAISQLAEQAAAMQAASQLGEALAASDLAPVDYKRKAGNATVAILYGAELGLSPIQSIQQIFVVHGKPAIYARTMVALVKTRGYAVQTVSSTDESVTVKAVDLKTGIEEASTWDIARARKAGYLTNKKYESDPQAMLYAKAATEVCRKIAPEVLLGIPYSREELELEDQPTPIRRVRNESGVDGLRNALGVGPEATSDSVEKQDTTQVKAPAKPTKKQADELDRLFADANLETNNWAARYVVINRTVNRAEPVTDIRTLTRDEVADLITTLGGLQAEGVLVETVENMLLEDAQAKDAQN